MLPLLMVMTQSEDDRIKLEALYNTYGHRMYKLAYKILKDYHLAEDAVQMAFIKIIKHLDKIKKIDCKETRAFLVIIIRSTAIDLYRKRDSEAVPLELFEETASSDEESIDDKIVRAEMFAEAVEKIKVLPSQYADVIALRYFYHYSDQEIAELLGITVKNVWVRMHRAKQNLIKLLNQDEEV